MAIFNFIFYYLIKSWRQNRKRRAKRAKRAKRNARGVKLKNVGKDVEKNDEVDGNISDDEEEDEDESPERSAFSSLILMWGVFEVLTLIIALIFMEKEGFPYNYMGALCDHRRSSCENITSRIIYYKMLVTVLLLIGEKYVSEINFINRICKS